MRRVASIYRKNDNSIKHWVLLYYDLCIKTFQSIYFFFFFKVRTRLSPVGSRAFSGFFAPSTCNDFPLRQKPSLETGLIPM